jgi:trehalose 6-phosphate synthase/phosphatase
MENNFAMQSLIIVSNRLPVTVTERIDRSSGGLVAALEGFGSVRNFKWIGWSGGTIDDENRRREVEEELVQRFGYHPVFLTASQSHAYYTGYSNSSLWPLLHYQPSYARFDEQWFEMYKHVNMLFADKIDQLATTGELVWIHDYHLLLLPQMLRRRRPDLRIGFFMHTPFPCYEIFRCHPDREALLQGLLGADLIGFHTSGYLRHFRGTVLRILGLESEINTILTESHNVAIGVFPISIPVEKFLEEMRSAEFHSNLAKYRKIYADKKVVLGVERLDYSKGVPRRLDAIKRFLADSGRLDVRFIFINVPSRESVSAYQELRKRIEMKVSQINGQFSTVTDAPIHFIHQSVTFSELCALYALADVAMVTPEIDGMNLVAKEYIVCQEEGDGALILSEFAGAAQELHQAYLVNPYDVDGMARTLAEALAAPKNERQRRLIPMRNRILRYHAHRWAESFIAELFQQTRHGEDALSEPRRIRTQILDNFWQSSHAALFLDYDGTLIPLRKHPADAVPDAFIGDLSKRLLALAGKVDTYLITGRPREDMDRWFDGYGFHLIAEHGLFFKHPGSAQWKEFEKFADLTWMDQVHRLLRHYSDMTPGSEVEVKTASLVWHYRNVEPDFGRWKAHQMVDELRAVLANLPVTIYHGRKIVEIGSLSINKGAIFQHFKTLNGYQTVLCAGDDETDESMFRAAGEHDISIKVGEGETAARFVISSPMALRELLYTTIPTND